jgi:hypothetical protein
MLQVGVTGINQTTGRKSKYLGFLYNICLQSDHIVLAVVVSACGAENIENIFAGPCVNLIPEWHQI